jgi:hypothetical protein
MSDIVKSLRRHQKMMILVAAIGVVSLYLLPLDQIFAQTSTEARINARFQQAHDQTDTAFNNAIQRVANSRLPSVNPDQYNAIVSNLEDQRDFLHQVLSEHNYRLLGQIPPGAP